MAEQQNVFLPKDHPDMPVAYGLELVYKNGKKEEFELTEHHINVELDLFDICTSDDMWVWVKFSDIARFNWGKRWSKVVAIKVELEEKSRNNS